MKHPARVSGSLTLILFPIPIVIVAVATLACGQPRRRRRGGRRRADLRHPQLQDRPGRRPGRRKGHDHHPRRAHRVPRTCRQGQSPRGRRDRRSRRAHRLSRPHLRLLEPVHGTAGPGRRGRKRLRSRASRRPKPSSPRRTGSRRGPGFSSSTSSSPRRPPSKASTRRASRPCSSAPTRGIFEGQSVLLNLNGEPLPPMVLRNGAALHINFTTERGGYPSSLMGTIAHIRQSFIDAEYYAARQAQYAKGPAGLKRTEYDPRLEALVPFVRDRKPVVFQCNNVEDIKRALKIAAEFKLNALLAGANEAWRAADVLKKNPVPLLVALDFRPPAASMYATQGEELRKKAEAEIYPANAAALAKEGIAFALVSAGERRRGLRPQGRARRDQGRPGGGRRPAGPDHPAGPLPRPRPVARDARAGQDRQRRPGQGRDLRREGPGLEGLRRRRPVQVRGGVQMRNAALLPRFAVFALLAAAALVPVAIADGGDILIKNGTVLTVTKGVVKGDVLVIDGIIKEIGGTIAAPPGVRVVDAAGRFVLPGIIDSHTHIALAGTNEGSEAITPGSRRGRRHQRRRHGHPDRPERRRDHGPHHARQRQPDRRAERRPQDEMGPPVRGARGEGGPADAQVRPGRERQAVRAGPSSPGRPSATRRRAWAPTPSSAASSRRRGTTWRSGTATSGDGARPRRRPAISSRPARTCAWRSWPRSSAASGSPAATATRRRRRSSSWSWPRSSGSRSSASSTSGRDTRSPTSWPRPGSGSRSSPTAGPTRWRRPRASPTTPGTAPSAASSSPSTPTAASASAACSTTPPRP